MANYWPEAKKLTRDFRDGPFIKITNGLRGQLSFTRTTLFRFLAGLIESIIL